MSSSSLQRVGNYLRTRWVSPHRIRFWLLVLLTLYTLLGFFGLPWIIQYFAVNTIKEDFGRELRIESVKTNPYTLTLQVNGLQLADRDSHQLLAWERLRVDLNWNSITNKAWTFQSIQFDNATLQEERFIDGTTRFSLLAEELASEPSNDGQAGSPPALQIKQLAVNNSTLRFTDNLQQTGSDTDESEQVLLALQQLSISLKNVALQQDSSSPLHLTGQLAAGGRLAFDGKVKLLPAPALEGTASISKLALKQAEPYLQQFANVQLDSGQLTVNGQINIDQQQPFAFLGLAIIDSLSLRDRANDQALIGWQSLSTERLDLNLADNQIETDPITIKELSGRIVIREDQTTNFSQLLTEAPEQAETNTSQGDKSDPFNITIQGIELAEGILQFADNSLPLPFSTRIHTLKGELSTLSSSSSEPATIKLEGEVANYGLAQVDGAVHAWHPMRQTNVHLRFRNLQIPEYSPYTVNFAGRKIAGGTMDLDLNYRVDNNQLDGENNLLLHDLKLGEKMASSDAMDLPLDLAIALLQDNDGVIDLTLPVSGDVGNPQFDFGKVIQQAIGDAISSIVTAPFSFLANLIGADSEELAQVEFINGRADLLPPQRQRIENLREALKQRPKLVLELAGPFNPNFDGPALQQQKAIEALRQHLAEKDSEVSNKPSLTAEANQSAVEALFTRYYPDTELESVQARFTEDQNEFDSAVTFDALAYRSYLARQVVEAQSVAAEDLKTLANARAEAVKIALIEHSDSTIAADRVRILEPQQADTLDNERIAMKVGISAD
ncbi:DUF748 domain-containing protein [Idiomarina seosinensis]|uniref:DUF748 domain-containing protein n=1 Tax=Idiomarina seosinensis TaxID=281739 RepID=A0A432ZJG1_9GAMM|nr:DUF748 domain-containing protein [Idiomarina seosinensis]RUO78024.1 hypothetical protein CWI81_06030 [Idiomarina seosinensis]